MTFSAFYHQAGISIVSDVRIVQCDPGEGGEPPVTGDFCYILQVARVVASEGAPVRALPVCPGLVERPFVMPEGMSLRKIESFVCRSLQTAREMMLDSELLRTDWILRSEESDEDGKVLEVFLSTDGHYVAKISRTELF